MSDRTPSRGSAENAWATQLQAGFSRVPTVEPHYTKKDDRLYQYGFERCIEFVWGEDEETGERVRVAENIVYQDILDTLNFETTHLKSISNYDTERATVMESEYNLSRHIMEVKYEALADEDALHLIRVISGEVESIIWGRAYEGSHQNYDAAVAGANRKITIDQESRKKGLFGRGS